MAYAKETICIQSGWKPKNGEPRVLPIYQSTTFKYESSEQMGRLFDLEESGYFYSRLANPTNDCVAQKICELEGGAAAMLTGSDRRQTTMPFSISARRATMSYCRPPYTAELSICWRLP